MSDDKAPETPLRVPAPRALDEDVAKRPDARTAEVLRALDRAKGTIGGTEVPIGSPSSETPVWELRAPGAWLSRMSPVVDDAAKRLASCAERLERAVVVPSEKLAEIQRHHGGIVRGLRESARALEHEADVFAAWRTWWTTHVAAWTLVLMALFGATLGLAWRAHTLAQSTHDILEQILENQTKAQAAKPGKRR